MNIPDSHCPVAVCHPHRMQPVMSRLGDLRAHASVLGILPNCVATVVKAQWFCSEALELTYKDPSSKVTNELLYRHDEPRPARHDLAGDRNRLGTPSQERLTACNRRPDVSLLADSG